MYEVIVYTLFLEGVYSSPFFPGDVRFEMYDHNEFL